MQVYNVLLKTEASESRHLLDLTNGMLGHIAKQPEGWTAEYAEQARIILLAHPLKLLPNVEDPQPEQRPVNDTPHWCEALGYWAMIAYAFFLLSLPISFTLWHG